MVRFDRVYPAALTCCTELPGDVALTVVVQSVGQQEQRRFGSLDGTTSDGEIDLRTVSERVVISSYSGRGG